MKFLKKAIAILLIPFLLFLLVFNLSLFYQPSFEKYDNSYLNKDLIHQLPHLKEKLHSGAGTEMQQLYPEGFFFQHALYGLT